MTVCNLTFILANLQLGNELSTVPMGTII